MRFLDKIDNVSGSNVIKKVLQWRSGKMFATREVNAWTDASFISFPIVKSFMAVNS